LAGGDFEVVNQLSAPWRLTGSGKLAIARDDVDGTGFAGVGPTGKCNFGMAVLWQLIECAGTFRKSGIEIDRIDHCLAPCPPVTDDWLEQSWKTLIQSEGFTPRRFGMSEAVLLKDNLRCDDA
jgi:hypothetical protein